MTTFTVTNSHQLAIVVASLVGVTLATICVALRFRARRLRKQPTEFDDWFCVAALILTWAFEAVNMAAVFVGGAGLPVATVNEIDPHAVAVYYKIMFASSVLWFSTVIVVQLSIIFFYDRIFGVNSTFKWACNTLAAMITLFWVSGLSSMIFCCVPVSRSWGSEEAGTCLPYKPYCASVGVLHVFFDFAILALPLPMIWNLQLGLRNKIILSGVLCLGLVATVISFLGIVCIVDLTGISPSDVTDYLWLSILFQTLELPIGIICCCVPNLKPIADKISDACSSLIHRLLCCFRRPRRSQDSLNGLISEHEAKAPFAHLNGGSPNGSPTSVDMRHLPDEFLGYQGSADLRSNDGSSAVV